MILQLYQQQKHMFDNRTHTVENRIVSISQPHVRSIVRGKTKAPTEFGAKVEISVVNGYVRMKKLNYCKENGISITGPALGRPKVIVKNLTSR